MTTEARFKIGDKVRINPELRRDQKNDRFHVNLSMMRMAEDGRTHTISKIIPSGNEINYEVEGHVFGWDESWLVPLVEYNSKSELTEALKKGKLSDEEYLQGLLTVKEV